MTGRRLVAAVLAALLVPAAVAPGGAAALGLTVPTSAVLPALSPGRTSTTPLASAIVVATLLEPWALRVSDSSGSSAPGHLTRASATGSCANSATALANPLHLSLTSTLPTGAVDVPELDLGATPTTVAHGAIAGTVAVIFSQAIGLNEQVAAGCTYQTTLTWTVIGS